MPAKDKSDAIARQMLAALVKCLREARKQTDNWASLAKEKPENHAYISLYDHGSAEECALQNVYCELDQIYYNKERD